MPGTFNRLLRQQSRWHFAIALGILLSLWVAAAAGAPLCLYVSSYDKGDAWSDGVEQSLRKTLAGHCEVASFYMDTHRYQNSEDKQKAGVAASALARDLQADVVITSDDNAAKYLVVPHLVDTATPVVFTGINWTISEYGLPASNVTGMVEVVPIKSILTNALDAPLQTQEERMPVSRKLCGNGRILFIGADNLSERKMLFGIDALANSFGMGVDSILVGNFESWLNGFKIAQNYDLVIIGDNAGIHDWDDRTAERFTQEHTRVLSVTYNDWMMAYSVLGYTRQAAEQGEWAALSAIAILDGLPVSDIPVVANRRVETWVNLKLLSFSKLHLSPQLINGARKYF